MPYKSVSEIPDRIKGTPKQKRMWMHVWNSAYAAAIKDGKSPKEAESIAFERASGVLKKRKANMEGLMPGAAAVVRGMIAQFKGKTKRENGHDFPAAAYAYVGDADQPSTWKLRLWETPTSKETAKQVGMAVAALGPGGFRGNKADIPSAALSAVKAKVKSAWRRTHKGETGKMPAHLAAAFSADPVAVEAKLPWANFAVLADGAEAAAEEENPEYVIRYGPVMKTGDYSDKGLGVVTVDDLAKNAASFQPADMDLQHLSDQVQTILDGKLGALVALHHDADAEPDVLYGTVMVPAWLDALQQTPDERQVSTTWHIPTRTIQKMAWVVEPRVEGAKLEDAYATFSQEMYATLAPSKHNTYPGQRAIQRLHDQAAEAGAVCKRPSANGSAKMHSAHERDGLQAIHDAACAHGASCDNQAVKEATPYPYYGGLFAAAPTTTGAADTSQEDTRMKPSELLKKLAQLAADEEAKGTVNTDGDSDDDEEEGEGTGGGEGEKQGEQQPAPAPATAKKKGAPAEERQPVAAGMSRNDPEWSRLSAENARLRREKIDRKAAEVAEAAVKAEKIFPSEQAVFAALYAQAMSDDEALIPTLAHLGANSDGSGGVNSRVALIERYLEITPAHKMTQEMLAAPARALFSMANPSGTAFKQDDNVPPNESEMTELIGKTSVGRALLNQRDGVTRPHAN